MPMWRRYDNKLLQLEKEPYKKLWVLAERKNLKSE